MKKHIVPPVAVIAVAAAAVFYGLYVFSLTGVHIASFIFLAALLLLCVLLLFLTAVSATDKLAHRNLKLREQCCRNHRPAIRIRRIRIAGRCALCIAAGATIGSYSALALQKNQRPPETLTALPAVRTVFAELTGEPVPAGTDYYRLPVTLIACITGRNEQFSASGAVQLLVPAALVRGTYSGGITRVGEAVHPTAAPLLPGTAAFAEYLQNPDVCRFYVRGMRLSIDGRFGKTGTVFYAKPIQPVFLGWASSLSRIRAFFRFAFMRLLYGWGEAGGLLLALLAADKAFLPAACTEAFRNAGLAHILALSGMHLSLIGTTALQGGRVFGHKKRAVWFSLAAVCLFVWFAGSAPSLNRALGMVCIAAAGEALGLKPPPLSVLCAMLTVHIAIGSTDAITLGFMLSYGACAGIIIFGDACAHLMEGTIPPAGAESISASVGAQLFTAPIVVAAIGAIAAAGVIASCVVSPLVSVFLIAGLICIPLALLCPPITPLLGYGLNASYRIIFAAADFFARLPLITPETGVGRLIFSAAAFSAGVFFTAWAYFRNKKAITRLPRLT